MMSARQSTQVESKDFSSVLNNRKQCRANLEYNGNLNRGTSFPIASILPYSFAETYRFFMGSLLGDYASQNECAHVAPIGMQQEGHSVGVKEGTLEKRIALSAITTSKSTHHNNNSSRKTKLKIVFSGDLMVSESGSSVQLGQTALDELKVADALVINIESPVSFNNSTAGRAGLQFEMSTPYLADFVGQIYSVNKKIKIIYNIANNHALDGNDGINPDQLSKEEKPLYDADPQNFVLLRTISAIRKIDKKSIVIGAHFPESMFADLGVQTDIIAIIEKNGLRVGVLGFTDILNNNATYWDRRVSRTEDIPPADLAPLKLQHHLDYLYLYGHGSLEQSIYPTLHWRDIAVTFLENGADGFVGHGPHVPQTNEVIRSDDDDQDKLLVHSVGNFFGPKKLYNTGLNLLAVIEFRKDSAEFMMKPIQATIKDNAPVVDCITNRATLYPSLLARIDNLYPIANFIPKSDSTQIQYSN